MSKTVEAHVMSEYSIIRQMGSGAYGHVWEVKNKKTGKLFALKKVFDAFRNSIDAQRTYRQVEVLHKLKHENIIKLFRVIKSKNNKDLYLIFEFMEADLHSVVGTSILQKMHQIYIFHQILKGILYIHSAELIHRDLKPSNVLINSECKAKICDFGLVRSLACEENEEIILSEEVATKWYRAPQLLLGSRNYGKPVDMWSFGCIVAQILTGKPLFAGNSTLNQFEKIVEYTGEISHSDIQSLDSPIAQQLLTQINIKKKSFREYFHAVDPVFYELLTRSLEFNPNKRITTEEALKLPIFQDFEQDPLIILEEPIIPTIDDNIRLATKAYRQKIYEDIDKRYESLPFKSRINQMKPRSVPKRQKERSSSKKRPQSAKKIDTDTKSVKKSQSSLYFSKPVSGYLNSPYYKSIKKSSLLSPPQKCQSPMPKIVKKQLPCSVSSKLIKRGARHKLYENEKKNILKSIGVEKPKKLNKYLK